MSSRQHIEKHLKTLSHNDQIAFALYCVKYCYKYNNATTCPAVDKVILLLTNKLQGKNVSKQELLDARFAADAAYAAAYAAYAAAYATYAAYAAAYAAYADAYAANAAAYAANAADAAAYAAYAAAYATYAAYAAAYAAYADAYAANAAAYAANAAADAAAYAAYARQKVYDELYQALITNKYKLKTIKNTPKGTL